MRAQVVFCVDILLNLHTAYYNDSGDLVGIKMSGKNAGKADFMKLYWNYATGWMTIDVMSVLPIDLILRWINDNNKRSGEELKVLKVLRLVRLLKLLRVARGLQIFKKHEDTLGPAVGGCITISTCSSLQNTLVQKPHSCCSDEI